MQSLEDQLRKRQGTEDRLQLVENEFRTTVSQLKTQSAHMQEQAQAEISKLQGDLIWTAWSQPLESSGSVLLSSGRWIEVRIEFESRDGKAAPVLHDIGVSFTSPRVGRKPGSTSPPATEALPEDQHDP